MVYGEKDFVETESPDILKQNVHARALTKAYYSCDYKDKERKRSILQELLGSRVNKSIPANCVAEGNSSRVIRYIEIGGKKMKYNHIVFDIDGTLLDTEYSVLYSLQKTIMEVSSKCIPVEELTFALGITGEDALKILNISDIPFTLELWNHNMRQLKDTVTVFKGLNEVLDELFAHKVHMGIVTSKTREEFQKDFIPFGLDKYFEISVCADDTEEHKPNPAPLCKYMELTGTEQGQVLYIGDSKYDSQCARSAGTDFALAVWGSHSWTIRAEYFLENPRDLLSILEP